MQGLALALVGVCLAAEPIELDKDVEEMPTRDFAMPLRLAPDRKERVERIRLFVSEDRGKTWKHEKDYKPSDTEVVFSAPRDGLYWFALQVVLKDGKSEPPKLEELPAAMKVYINSQRKALKPKKSYEELQNEVWELRGLVEELRKRIKRLESERPPGVSPCPPPPLG